MDFHSWLFDKKVHGVNVSVDISVGEYWEVSREIVLENDLQRARVSSRGKPYQLLQRDLIDGCVMPPIILALKQERSSDVAQVVKGIRSGRIEEHDKELLSSAINDAFIARDVLILDGLQRTYTLGDSIASLKDSLEARNNFLEKKLRLEIYVGLNKTGILYRMLTLNTGQTPMSFRHQIEMLYHDHLDDEQLPDNIVVVREADERRARGAAKYKFSDVVDMYYAFSTGRPESIDRQTLVNRLGELDFLEEYESTNSDLQSLLVAYNRLVRRIEFNAGEWEFNIKDLQADLPDATVERPFGRNVASIFERVQAMTAFGAEVKRLFKLSQIHSYADLNKIIDACAFESDAPQSLNMLVMMLDDIARKATKIGTAQRDFFQFSFRALLNSDSEAFKDLSRTWVEGQRKFESLNY
jgi:hypothetical protein